MKISILGSTGSIGTNTLKIIEKFPEKCRVVALAAGENIELFASQIKKFKPRLACLARKEAVVNLKSHIGNLKNIEIVFGIDGIDRVAKLPDADVVVAAISGSAGLLPTISAVRAGKTVAIANKEALVMAGELIVQEARENNAKIIPVDSEHSAIFQLLKGRDKTDVRNIILTASGGPFLHYSKEDLERVTPEQALKHPRWKMGNKVTIDSASLMNKGLEVIEAHWLFGLLSENIKIVIHPQSIIHSMVEFIDGTVFAQLSHPDMQGPIAYALSFPQRFCDIVEPLNFANIGELTFSELDERKFPTIRLAYKALEAGGLMSTVMNAANEVAVQRFCERIIKFPSIPLVIEKIMERFQNDRIVNLESILGADRWARRESEKIIEEIK